MTEHETELLRKCKNGDVAAFEALISEYQKKVFSITYRMLGNYDDASEIAQEAFIKIYKSIKDFKGESSISTWIYRIVTNTCLDQLRKRKNRKVVSIDEENQLEDGEVKKQIADDKPGPETLLEKQEIKRVVHEAIGYLSEEHKSVIILRDIQGMSYDEIGKILKCPSGTVKSRINRARSALKSLLVNKKELLYQDYV